MLFNLESLAVLLHLDAKADVQVLVLGSGFGIVLSIDIVLRVVGVLYETAFVLRIQVNIYVVLYKFGVKVAHEEEFSCAVNHRTEIALAVDNHYQRRDSSSLCNLVIVGTESRSNVNDTGTVLGGNIVARNYAESTIGRLNPRENLLVAHIEKVFASVFGNDSVRNNLVTVLVFLEWKFCALRIQVSVYPFLCHYHGNRLAIIHIIGANCNIFNLAANAECCVRRQSPWRGCPSDEIRFSPASHFGLRVNDCELSGNCGVLYIAVAPRLVKFVCAKSSTCCRRIRLNGVALVKQVLVVQLLEQPPQSLDVAVIVCYVRIFEVNPVADALGKVGPVTCVFHHFATAGVVVVLYRNLLADVLLGDAESLFHAEFHRQTVGIPAGLTVNLVTCQSLVAAYDILDCTSHNMVDTRHSVC